MPLLPSSKPVGPGGWLTNSGTDGSLFAAKGNKTPDFYGFGYEMRRWDTLASIPLGVEDKYPGAGCSGISDAQGSIYMAKGNNTRGFWHYDIARDSWSQLADVPTGNPEKRAKGGTSVAYAVRRDTGWVYLLKGGTRQFFKYNTATRTWQQLVDAPLGQGKPFGKGSWITYDGERKLYAYKAKQDEMYRYDVATDSWEARALSPMPTIGRMGKPKKSGDGCSATWKGGYMYAFKGGNTQEFWRYNTATDSWTELDTLPIIGTAAKKRKVKAGAGLSSFGNWDTIYVGQMLFALKGNKTCEFWWKGLDLPLGGGVFVGEVVRSLPPLPRFHVRPSLVSGRVAYIDYHLEQPGLAVIQVSDAAGRIRLTRRFRANAIGLFCLHMPELPPGTYLVTLKSGGKSRTQKLVVHR